MISDKGDNFVHPLGYKIYKNTLNNTLKGIILKENVLFIPDCI